MSKMLKKKKVLVGMSGGVDSSVTAALLKEQGYDVIGIHMHFWADPSVFSEEESKKFPQNKCCTLEGLSKVRRIADRLNIPFYVVNYEEEFKKEVVDFFVEGYSKGETPNPCIECNRNIKFGLFLKKMKDLDADFVATGHYARRVIVKDATRERYELWMAKDKAKDQSYFLYVLTQEKLKHILFPLGDYTKTEVREMAKKFGINEVNEQKESQNLCFFPERTHGPFLKRYLQQRAFTPGPICTVDGKEIGTHKGLPLYTIGQRKGIDIGGLKGFTNQEGNPWYVVKIDQAKNALIVGKRDDLYQKKLKAKNLSFIGEEILENPYKLQARIRYHAPISNATYKAIEGVDAGKTGIQAQIEFDTPQSAITPGQSVVFYDGEKVLGGGIIAK